MNTQLKPAFLFTALVAGLLTSACHKQESPPPAPKPAAPAQSAAAPAAVPEAGGEVNSQPSPVQTKGQALMRMDDTASTEAHVKMLTDALNVWEDWHGKSPASLNQLVEKKILDHLPAPPPGMKFVIDPTRHVVTLQSQ